MAEERICKICGTPFTPWRSTQQCCSKACMRVNTRLNVDNYHARQKELGKSKSVALPPTKSKHKQQSEWAVIIRKCEAAGLSYGEAVARGILDE